MTSLRPLLIAMALVVAAPSVAIAHGGEDHGAPPPRATAGSDRASEAVSEQVEAVIKYAAADASEPHALRLYLTDYATNAPISAAQVSLTVPDLGISVDGVPDGSLPGAYTFVLSPGRQGGFAAILSISGGEHADLVSFDELVFGPTPGEDAPPMQPGVGQIAVAAFVVALVVFLVGRIVLVRRRRVRQSARDGAVIAAMLGLLISRGILAHGGEDHSAAPKTQGVSTVAIVPKEAQLAFGIRTLAATGSMIPKRLDLKGIVMAPPEARAEVIALLPGRVVAPSAPIPRIGDRVRKGQALLALEGSLDASQQVDVTRALVEARGRSASADAELRAAERDAARVEAVPEIVSQKERDDAVARLESARASSTAASRDLDVLGAALGSAGRSARTLTLTSPIDGIVTSADVTLGEGVEAGRVFFRIIDSTRLWVRADVPEREASVARTLAGATAQVVVPGPRTSPVTARHVASTGTIDRETRTVSVFFETDNAAGALLEGMLVEIHAETEARAMAFMVPASAITSLSGRTLVFVHVQPEEFAPRDVVVGLASGGDVEVVSGLEEGDRVVVSGTYQVRAALLSGGGA